MIDGNLQGLTLYGCRPCTAAVRLPPGMVADGVESGHITAMPTPSDLLGDISDDSVLLHEAGHTAAGLLLGAVESEIVFYKNPGRDRAGASGQQGNASMENMVSRSLAGGFISARRGYARGNEFEPRMRSGPLIPAGEDLCIFGRLMDSNFCSTDWQGILDRWTSSLPLPQKKAESVNRAHLKLIELCADRRMDALVDAIVDDIRQWMDRPNDDADPLADAISYPGHLAGMVFTKLFPGAKLTPPRTTHTYRRRR